MGLGYLQWIYETSKINPIHLKSIQDIINEHKTSILSHMKDGERTTLETRLKLMMSRV